MLFPPPPPVLLPVRGSARLFPVNRIFCVGRNYAAHAAEMGAKADKENPFYFTKNSRAVLASGATMPYPLESDDVHHEVELVAALGEPLFRATRENALDAVFGYACGLDMTRRDLQ
ncbi:MAG: fumarylacetoacetate hydrolase family protein, partial [Hyphomicrobiales bacterium]|nr:fumarylacetoacetate hydrolase family protein [Hyphomicrobiales bacterium]